MIPKFFLELLEAVVQYVMGSNGEDAGGASEEDDGVYRFRAFKYQKVDPQGQRTPLPRSGHRIVCDTKNLYSFGGYNPLVQPDSDVRHEDEFRVHAFPLFQELWKFNFAAKKWSRFGDRETLPQELASNAVVLRGNCLMVYGGTGSPFGERCSNQLYLCSLADGKGAMCEVSTTGQKPLPQYGQALVYHNDYLYTIGGTTGFNYTCDIHRLNMKTMVWENVYICQGHTDYEPQGRYRHEVAFDGNDIYILGGGTAELAFDFDKLPVFNLEKRVWKELQTLGDPRYPDSGIPQPRRCHGAVQVPTDSGHSHVFVSGGYDGVDVFNDLWKLDLSTLQWSLIETCQLPFPTYFHSTAVTPEGKLYVFGGIFFNDDLKRNNLVHSTWLCVPKLSEMCWEALLHYRPGIINCPKENLLNDGLPRHFVARLE